MQIRNLGGSGLRVSAVGLGCNNFGQRTDLETSRKVIHKAIDLGITLFDTADIYAGMGGSETVLGECSARAARTSCWRRNTPSR
jgi:aryl-alcohol dehydrogenase-like predicted oxidoreductase